MNRQANEEILLQKRLEARADGLVEGLKAVVSVDGGRTAGVGPARENAALPAAGNQSPKRAEYNLASLYGRGSVTGQLIRSTRNNAAAFARGLKYEADGLYRDVRDDFARQTYGGYDVSSAGGTGGLNGSAAIARVNGSPSANVITLDDDHAIRAGHLYVGMLIDATDDFASTEETGMAITAVTVATPSITVDDDGNTADDDWIVRSGAVDTSGSAEMYGISAAISTTTYGSLNPATAGQEFWKSTVDTDGGAFDSDNLHSVFNRVRIDSGSGPSALYSTFGLQREYYNELQAQQQFVEPMEFEGGFRVLKFFNLPFIADVDCPLGNIYLPDEKAIHFACESKDWKPLDEDGHMLKWVTGYDKWEWALQRDVQLVAERRNSSGKMTGLTDSGY